MKKELMEVFEHQRQGALSLEVGTKESQIATENVIKLAEAVQKSEELQQEIAEKKNQDKKEKLDRWLKFGIEAGKIIIPLSVAVTMGLISMVWETDGHTMTNTTGRNSWRDIIRFK